MLVLMTAGRGLAMLITDGQIITVTNGTFSEIAGGNLLALPVTVVIAGVVYALVALATRRTALGTLIEAVGINPAASRLAGVRSRAIIWTVYVFAALCAGVAGLMISSNVNAADANNAGLWLELEAILAVVIGGTLLSGGRYSIVGTLVGALTIQTLTTTIYAVGIAPEISLVFKAAVVIVVCLLQSPKARLLLARRRGRDDGIPPPDAVPPAEPPPDAAGTPETPARRAEAARTVP
jgi:simple sugar transport system permease protein